MNFYIFFHLNIFFSSIKIKQREEVIKKCYWPLLLLAESSKVPIAIEASGITLEIIKFLDVNFINKLKNLIKLKKIIFIGSGYSQIIGPLNLKKINQSNLEEGNKIYEKILKIKPKICLVNEQSFSKGLIKNYLKAGYKKIIMESNNLFSSNKHWLEKLKRFPQFLSDDFNNKIEVIWNDTLLFQKFQRFVHGDIAEEEYFKFINFYTKNKKGYFCVYGNDCEIFNFRPGRFKEEKKINFDEWSIIKNILNKLSLKYNFVKINSIKSYKKSTLKSLKFENTCYVKKQHKYNISRWAVTGKNDIWLNSLLFKLYKSLDTKYFNKNIKKILYISSSDFRTHIDNMRWKELKNYIKKNKIFNLNFIKKEKKINYKKYISNNNFFHFENKICKAIFNIKKGISIEQLYNKKNKNNFFIKTLKQGHFSNIEYLVDYFSSNLLLHSKKYGKITNLEKGKISFYDNNEEICFKNYLEYGSYKIEKKIILKKNVNIIELECKVRTNLINDINVLRPFHFTFNCPHKNINILLNNGGDEEKYILSRDQNVQQSKELNSYVSCKTLSGMTGNCLKIIADNKKIIFVDQIKEYKLYPMIDFVKINKKYLFRIIFTSKESDDTSAKNELKKISCHLKIKY